MLSSARLAQLTCALLEFLAFLTIVSWGITCLWPRFPWRQAESLPETPGFLGHGLAELLPESPTGFRPREQGLDRPWQRLQRFAGVRERIRELCRPSVGKKVDGMIIEPTFRLGYCINNKAGSSTIVTHLWKLHKKTQKFSWTRLMKHMESSKVGVADTASLNSYRRKHGIFLFSFVRHPFERLVSGFINKVGYRMDPAEGWQNFAKRMNYSFPTFVNYVIEELKEGKADNHWKPFDARCHPCLVDFDFIGRQEDFAKDLQYVVAASNLTKKDLDMDSRFMSSQGAERSNHGQRTAKYFAMIPQEQRQTLYELYRRDFELFGYSPDPYL